MSTPKHVYEKFAEELAADLLAIRVKLDEDNHHPVADDVAALMAKTLQFKEDLQPAPEAKK